MDFLDAEVVDSVFMLVLYVMAMTIVEMVVMKKTVVGNYIHNI